jgi:branched-chain amino acid transport system ATP-binding protein
MMASSVALLECEAITVRFGGLTALNGVEVSCFQGEILGLIGPNGSGKTTLFNVITGVVRPQAGRVRLAGQDITGLAPHQTSHRGIARTYQLVRPFASLSVHENVLAGIAFRRRADHSRSVRSEAAELLELVGLADRAHQPASHLTLVQRKRLEVARALGTHPRLLLLDEVVAGLNPAEADGMLRLIDSLRQAGLTVIVIEHNMRVIMGLSDRIVVLHHGEKLAEGTREQVSQDPLVVEAYLGQAANPDEAAIS